MKIIDKNKDFYDFWAYQPDSDEETVFDRRGSIMLTKGTLCKTINEGSGAGRFVNGEFVPIPMYPYHDFIFDFKNKEAKSPFFIIALAAGFTFSIIKWTNLKYENSDPIRFYVSPLLDFDMELVCTVKWYEYSGSPLCLYVPSSSQYVIPKMTVDDWKNANFSNISFRPFFETQSDTVFPILANAGFASIIQPEAIYRGIEEYLLAEKNDKPVESIGLTDVDKAVNHGFDKKTSFRNMK